VVRTQLPPAGRRRRGCACACVLSAEAVQFGVEGRWSRCRMLSLGADVGHACVRALFVCTGDTMAVDPVASMLAGVTNNVSQQADYPPAVRKKPLLRQPRAMSRERGKGEKE